MSASAQSAADSELFTAYLALSHIITVPASSPLAPLPGEAPEESPRYYVARATWGLTHTLISPDLPPTLREDLAALAPERALANPGAISRLFAQRHVVSLNVWLGRTARFPEDLDPALTAGVAALPSGIDVYGEAAPARRDTPSAPAAPLAAPNFISRQFAIIVDGLVVATCESSRESGVAAEAWVRTLAAYRGRGYATRVTAAWALDARQRGKEPFYSHHRENLASAGVARALRLIPFLEDVGYL
ncbi:MAG TPA: GNAT family N-acetyltransferase [Ktedonobacterales bacterium]